MIKVLFVCLGNICRSPLAEAIFNHKLKQQSLDHLFFVDSCGTGDYHIGSQPDSRTIKSAEKHGVPISHACRQLIQQDIVDFHYIVAMDKSNHQNIMRLAGSSLHQEKIIMMRDFDSIRQGSDVPDPYHGGEHEFQAVFDILNRSLERFIEYLRKEHSV